MTARLPRPHLALTLRLRLRFRLHLRFRLRLRPRYIRATSGGSEEQFPIQARDAMKTDVLNNNS